MGRFLDLIRSNSGKTQEPEVISCVTHTTKETKLTKEVFPADIPENAWQWIEERSAIMEIDGGLNRDEANHRAFMLWYRRFVEGNTSQ